MQPPPRGLAEVAGAWLLFVTLAGDLGQEDRAIPMYDRLIARFGDEVTEGVRETVGRARLSRAALLGRGGDLDEAITACDEVLSEIDVQDESCLRVIRAMALSDRGHWLHKAGRHDEAMASYRAVIKGFEEGQDPDIDASLTRARAGVETG